MTMAPADGDVFGWIAVVAGTVATLWTIAAGLYWTFRPGERDPDHPKCLILKDDR
jgi:hypothetical protein